MVGSHKANVMDELHGDIRIPSFMMYSYHLYLQSQNDCNGKERTTGISG